MIPILEEYFEIESCIYKLYYGKKYVIVKGKTLSGSIYLIEKGYANFITAWGGVKGKECDDVNSYYKKFYIYIHKNPKLQFKIEVILESNNGYELLLKEHIELNLSMHDKKCLNNNVESYVPKFREKTQSYGWLSKQDVDSFNEFLSSM